MTKHDDLLRQLDRGDDEVMHEAAELIRKYEREAEAAIAKATTEHPASTP